MGCAAQVGPCSQSDQYESSQESGDLGCDSYGDRLQVSWLINPTNSGLRILLTFSEFDTEANYDFVSIYDGMDQNAPLLGSFSGSVIPGPFSSSGNALLVVFTADEYVEGGGFSASWTSFSVEDGITPCTTSQSHEINADEGSFGCDGYGNSITTSWHITGNPGERLVLHFEVFNTERNYDVVTVYDGGNGNAEIVGTFSGSDVPPPVTSTSNELYVTFQTDYSLTTTGFTASFTSLVQFADPCYNSTNKVLFAREGYVGCPYGYGNNVNSTWLINMIGNVLIRLDFLSLDLEENHDYVTVYDGATFSSPSLGHFSGNSTPTPVTSSGNHLLIAFTSDSRTVADGFTATFQSVHALQPNGCSRSGTFVLTSPEDSIGCEGYLPGIVEEWHIQAQGEEGDQVINLTWHSFDTEAGNDIVTVYDGNSTTSAVLQTASGSTVPDPVVSSGHWLLVRFQSNNNNIQGSGFSAIYDSVPVETDNYSCQSSHNYFLTDPEGVFGCDGYADNVVVSWQIHVESGFTILLDFDTFFTEALYDMVSIYDGPDDSAQALGSFSGAFRPPEIASASNYLYVVLTSDGGVTRSGFTAEYSSVFSGSDADSCFSSQDHTLTEPEGTFGCSGYGPDIEVTWSISVDASNTIAVDFIQFQTEFNYDVLRIYDGNSANAPQIASYSGYETPEPVHSSSNHLFISFSSDASVQYDGFHAEYHSVRSQSALTTCSSSTHETIHAPAGEIGCDGYGNDIDSSWLIQVAAGQKITLTFTTLSTELYYDYVKIYDGTNTHGTLMGTFSGDAVPLPITSTTNAFYITFHSDTSVSASYSGFVIDYVSFGSFDNSCSESADFVLDNSNGDFGCDGYASSVTVTWLIESFGNIFINFNHFDTEQNYDVLYIYDGSNENAPVLAQYSGTRAPSVSSTGDSIFLKFVSDSSINRGGFSAEFATAIIDVAYDE